MSKISNKEAVLLGLLCEGEKHPYDIGKDIQDRDMSYWTEISLSSIYKLLSKLEKKKLVKSEITITKNNITQKKYQITSEGKKRLKEKIKNLISTWTNIKHPIDIGLSNLYILKKEVVLSCFDKYIKSIDERIEFYKSVHSCLIDQKCSKAHLQLVLRPIEMLKAEKKWIKSFLRDLK
jgi:DNA-binding PadR family transcriptional regulator